MFLTLFGLFLKILGIGLSVPTAIRHFRAWKDRRCSELYELQHFYIKNGRKLPLPKWKRKLYGLVKMPMPHLWRDEHEKPSVVTRVMRRASSIRLRRRKLNNE